MSEHTPTTDEVRDSLVYLNKYHAKHHGDVDLMVVGSETAAQFDRMIAEVEHAAAEKALLEAACSPQANAFDTAVDLTRVRGPLFVSVKTWLTRTAAQYQRHEGEKA